MRINRNSWHYKAARSWKGNHGEIPSNLCPYFWAVVMGVLSFVFWSAAALLVALIILHVLSAPFIYSWHEWVSPVSWNTHLKVLHSLTEPGYALFGSLWWSLILSVSSYHYCKYLWWEVITESSWYERRMQRKTEKERNNRYNKLEKDRAQKEAYENSFLKVVVEFFKSKHDKVCPPLEFYVDDNK